MITRLSRRGRRALSAALGTAVLAVGAGFALAPGTRSAAAPGPVFTRWQGPDAYAQAAAIAEGAYPRGAGSAVIAATAADASGAAYLAGWAHAPLLLTAARSLPQATVKALSSLETHTVYVIGDTTVVGSAVTDALGHLGVPGGGHLSVVRVSGATPQDTALAAAEMPPLSYAAHIGQDRVGLLVAASDLPDQQAAADVSAGSGLPLLLTSGDALSPQARQVCAALGLTRIVTIGAAASSPQIIEPLKQAGLSVQSLADPQTGSGTAALASWAVSTLGYRADRIALAPALTAAPAAADAPIGATALAELAGIRREALIPAALDGSADPTALHYLSTVGHAITSADIADGTSVFSPATLTAVSTALASAPATRTGSLRVSVLDTPAATRATITITGPAGYF